MTCKKCEMIELYEKIKPDLKKEFKKIKLTYETYNIEVEIKFKTDKVKIKIVFIEPQYNYYISCTDVSTLFYNLSSYLTDFNIKRSISFMYDFNITRDIDNAILELTITPQDLGTSNLCISTVILDCVSGIFREFFNNVYKFEENAK